MSNEKAEKDEMIVDEDTYQNVPRCVVCMVHYSELKCPGWCWWYGVMRMRDAVECRMLIRTGILFYLSLFPNNHVVLVK
jgi:hypothetical protein